MLVDDGELARCVAHERLSFARARVIVVVARFSAGFAHRRRLALVLARTRCLAARDQQPSGTAARRVLELVDLALSVVQQSCGLHPPPTKADAVTRWGS